jgi:hypothetical protein
LAIADGNEDRAKDLTPKGLPDEIKVAYNNSHKS